jgi:hypothetical protein
MVSLLKMSCRNSKQLVVSFNYFTVNRIVNRNRIEPACCLINSALLHTKFPAAYTGCFGNNCTKLRLFFLSF